MIVFSRILAVVAVTGLGGAGAMAQETIGSYYAALGPQDYVNSKGARLRDFGAILQQDRANYHRFNRRDPQDQGDPFFGDAQRRAMIPALFAAGNNGWWNQHGVTPPTSAPLDADVLVIICTRNKMLSHIIVNHANGDGYNTCEGNVTAGD
ncbi:hypothetical protein [Lacimonas salitolerans]|uniref:Uncharacterized protein n=1 Tax=Lacimonas salitolerans TaxID=1323750 RepID=A0ABW4EJE0_9RHOB